MSGTRMNEFDEEPVDINTAGELKTKTAISKLRNELQLSSGEYEATEHFYHDNGLSGELTPLIDKCIPAYKRLIEDKIHATEWDTMKELGPYIAKEKTKLLETIVQFKIEKSKKIAATNNDEYSRQCSAAQPNQYIQLTNTYFYIKKNIVIALYNAARDYYKIILKNHEAKPAELAEKISSFNEKFKTIARIDPQTQTLSPLADAYKNYLHLTLTKNEFTHSFESSVDDVIKRCARTGNVLGQYADAFRCIQKRLNELNSREYVDPLMGTKISNSIFKPIAAPGEDTKASLLLYIPLATTTANLGSTLKSVVAGDAEQFTFSDTTRRLDDRINQAKGEFHTQLTVLQAYLQKVREDALKQLEADEKDFDYDRVCENIHAYSDLLREQHNLHGRIESSARTIHALLKQLEPKISAKTEFNRLASEHKLDTRVEVLEACVFDEDLDVKLQSIKDGLKATLRELAKQRDAVDQLVRESFDQDSMFQGQTFFCLHTEPLKKINAELSIINDSMRQVLSRIDEINEDQKSAGRLIEVFEIFKTCQDTIEQYSGKFTNNNLSLPHVQNATNDMLLPAINFYQEAHLSYRSLENEIKAEHTKILAARTHFMKSAKKEHYEILAACVDQILRQSNQQLQEAKDFVADSQKDTNLLLLCHLYVNALLNFHHWQSVRKITDTQRDIKSGSITYHLPSYIYDLVTIIKSETYAGWENNPELAKQMLEAFQIQAKKSSHNANVESFLAYLRNPINIEAPNNTEKLRTTLSDLTKICSSRHAELEPVIIRSHRLTTITPTPTYWEQHPILKKAIVGFFIGLAIVALTAIVIGIIIATHGVAAAAIVGAFNALAVTVGSAGAAAMVLTTMASGIVGMAAGIGAIIGAAQVTPASTTALTTKSNQTKPQFGTSGARVLSQLGFDHQPNSEDDDIDALSSQITRAPDAYFVAQTSDDDIALEDDSLSPRFDNP